MSTLGSINVKIGADAAGIVAGLAQARSAMGAMGRNAADMAVGAERAFRSIASGAASMAATVVKGVTASGDAIEKFGRKVRGAGREISSMGRTLSIGLTAPLSAAGLMALKASGDMEQTQVAFTTLLGSAQAAGDYIKGMKEFAAGTPFEFAGVKQASQQLMAFGFEAQEVEPMLRNIGDALSAMGNVSEEGIGRAVVALGQMKASGTVLKQDLNQLIALNIPVFDILSEKLGMTAAEVAKIGESGIDSSEAINALLEGLDEEFGGSMAAQSQTLLGLWSTLKDNASFIFADIGDAMVKAFDIKGKFMEATEGTAAFLAWFQGLDDSARRTALGIAVFMAALGPVLVVVGALVSALGSVIIAIGAILSPMGLLVAGVVAFGAAMVNAVLQSDVLWAGILGALPELSRAWDVAWEGMETIFGAFQAAFEGDWEEFDTLIHEGLAQMGEAIGVAWDAIWKALKPVVEAAFGDVVSWLKDQGLKLLAGFWELVKKDAADAWYLMKGYASEAWNSVAQSASDAWAQIKGEVLGVFATIGEKLSGLLASVKEFLGLSSDAQASWWNSGNRIDTSKPLPSDLPPLPPDMQNDALGGFISGPGTGTSDSIPAWLSNGEFVVNAASTRKFLPALQMMNAGKFADGGLVGDAGSSASGSLGNATKAMKDAADLAKDAAKAAKEAAAEQRAAASAAKAAAEESAKMFGTTGDFMKDIGYGAGTGQKVGDKSVHSLDGMTLKLEYFANTFPEKMKAVLGSFSANIADMFPTLKGAQKMWETMNQGNLFGQGLNTFLDFGALKSMQEGNLRLLAVMEKGGEALNSEWLDSLLGTSAAWGDSLAGQSAAIGQATEAQDVATASTQAMSESLIQATDSVSGSFVAAGEGVLASAAATAGAGEWMANTFLASGQVVNRAAASMSAGLASASSGVLGAASAAVSAIGSQLAQIGAGSGLSELARQMQNAGMTGAVESTLPGGSPSGLETSSVSMGSSRGNSRNGGGWVSSGYGPLPPIVLVLDGKEVHTSVQGYGNYYGASNVTGGMS